MLTITPNPGQEYQIKQTHSGLRKLNAAMLTTFRMAESFTGLTDGEGGPGLILGAFKSAAPYLHLSPQVVHAVDWLFRFTQTGDWASGMRPIVWPSASMQGEALCLSPTRVKALNRHLVELGLVAIRDSPNGKRYGRRDRAGRIIEAYGFDLSPLAVRLAEFRAIAAEGRLAREKMRLLRRRATIAQRGATQIAETAARIGLLDEKWGQIATESRQLSKQLTKVERIDELATGVALLERLHFEARNRLERVVAQINEPDAEPHEEASDSVNPDPRGAENEPHYYNYESTIDPEQDTVIALDKSKAFVASAVPQSEIEMPQHEKSMGSKSQDNRNTQRTGTEVHDQRTMLRITPGEVVGLAPRLRPYLATTTPNWLAIIEAADWLRHDLGVSKPLWGDACLAMGREQAAIALALVSAKPADHFRTTPGGYFHGMVKKAQKGELNLGRSIWGMRFVQGEATGKAPSVTRILS